MASNYKQPGDVIGFTAPAGGVTSGTAYLIGSLLVVALVSAAEGAEFQGATGGVWSLPKTAAQAWTEGQKIYWNAGTSKADSDGTTGILIGVAAVAADNPSSAGFVRLNGVAPAASEGPQAAIADLNLTALTDSPATADALRDDLTTNWEAPIENKINAILTALRAAGIIAT